MMLLKCNFPGLHAYILSNTLITCRAMQLRFFRSGKIVKQCLKCLCREVLLYLYVLFGYEFKKVYLIRKKKVQSGKLMQNQQTTIKFVI